MPMSETRSFRRWYVLHKWSSLICTVFLFMLCITGLPLIFSGEIREWMNNDPPYALVPEDRPPANLDEMVALAKRQFPGQIVTSISIDDDHPQTVVSLAPSWELSQSDKASNRRLRFDSRTGSFLGEFNAASKQSKDFLGFMLRLHMDLFARLPGQLFLGLMGFLFVFATISGVVLYGPFMKKLDFGTLRTDRSTRLKWLDLHNLLGIVTLAWVLIVGLTGILNELSTPLFTVWQRTDVNAMLLPWRGKPAPSQDQLSSVQHAVETAKKTMPGMAIVSVAFPGGAFGSSHHYLIWAKGDSPITSRLFTPLLIDARSGALTEIVSMPWYLRALELSRPLHFGDYGGLPLKLLWVILDLMTIFILGSGIYLWIARYRAERLRAHKVARTS